ncbi:flagellar transcriptional regulator FlhD [Caballeronia sp. TF1N1]|uniref:flagellar transcriptional regulator FlhD n=2 Tax=unclassified Caballeronia TaxID=2646786 RepID=UPI001FD48BB0|nr:flagellar transcriptional regulator FlhD [Caballeronia sp. TF1N1]
MTASTTTTLTEIRELNLAYLLLAQQLLLADRASAMARLALSDDVAQLLASLSPAQAVRVASSSHLLCRFRFDDHAILSSLDEKDKSAAPDATLLADALAIEAGSSAR